MISLGSLRGMIREVIAVGRNYKHAAILRRYVRARYGKVVVGKPTVVIGDALIAAERAPWRRLTVLAVLLVLGVRR